MLSFEYEEFKKQNSDVGLTYEDYRKAIAYIGNYDYESIKDRQLNLEKIVKGGIVVIGLALTASGAGAPYGIAILSGMGVSEITSAVAGVDLVSGRELGFEERAARSVIGAIAAAKGVSTLKDMLDMPTEQLMKSVGTEVDWGKIKGEVGDVSVGDAAVDVTNVDISNLPEGWTKTTNSGFTHVRDTNGNIRIRIDPPDKVTPYLHKHLYDNLGNSLDADGNIVNPSNPDAHIPIK